MEIVSIFADKLYAFHYDKERQDEYDRLMDLWTDAVYLVEFVDRNNRYLPSGLPIEIFVDQVWNDALDLDEELGQAGIDEAGELDKCFSPLHNGEYKFKILSLKKKRCRYLRLYAIKIDTDCYVITGGAIKLTQKMQEHPDTLEELRKIQQCKAYLQSKKIFDKDSFMEFFTE